MDGCISMVDTRMHVELRRVLVQTIRLFHNPVVVGACMSGWALLCSNMARRSAVECRRVQTLSLAGASMAV